MFLLWQVSTEAVAAELRALLRADAAGLILGVLLLAVGGVALLLYATRRGAKDHALLAFGLFSGLYGARLLVGQAATGLLTGLSEETLRTISAYITYVIVVPAFGFWERVLGQGWKSTLRLGVWVTIVFAVVAVTVESLWGAREILTAANNVLVIIGMILVMAVLFFRPPPVVPGLGALRLGSAVLAVFALGENLAGLGLPVWPEGYEVFGFSFFTCCLGYAAALRIESNERKLLAIENELEMAWRIQTSILPRELPRLPGLEMAVRYQPAASVAGDFYDFLIRDAGQVGVLVADVSGHGVPAALIASMVKVAFTSQAPHAEDPAAVLTGMNRIFSGHSAETFITAGYAFLDVGRRILRYASAGHPPLLLRRSRTGETHVFRENGIVMGPFADCHYPTTEFSLEPGDRLVLYTDGIIEAENAAGEFFGDERLQQSISSHAWNSPGDFGDTLLRELTAWSGSPVEGTQRDDVTLVVLDVVAD